MTRCVEQIPVKEYLRLLESWFISRRSLDESRSARESVPACEGGHDLWFDEAA